MQNASVTNDVSYYGAWPRNRTSQLARYTAAVFAAALTLSALAEQRTTADSLLAVDSHRSEIVLRLMTQWQSELPALQRESFREKLAGLRADSLLAASLVGSFDGVLEVLSAHEKSESSVDVHALSGAGEQSKAIGDPGRDMPYTPITPCKLIDTRGLTGTPIVGGAFAASERHSYAVPSGACAGLPTTGIGAILVSAATSSSSAGGGILSMMNVAATAPVTNIFGTGYASVNTILTSGSAGQFDAQISGVAGCI
jgi:hypothetical protein